VRSELRENEAQASQGRPAAAPRGAQA